MGMQYTPGKYYGRITNQGYGKTKDGSKDTFWIVFDLVGKIDPADPEGNLLPCNPGQRTAYWTITDASAEYFVKDMRRLGAPLKSFGELDPGNSDHHSFTGVDATFTCDENNYQGKQTERWQLARAGGDGPKAVPLDAKEARRLDAMFGAALKSDGPKKPVSRTVAPPTANPKANGSANAELTAEAAAHRNDDSIPF